MNTANFLSELFCAGVTSALEELAPLGKVVSAADVCAYLGLPEEAKALVSIAVSGGACPGYAIAKGRGIFREDNGDAKLTRVSTVAKEATPKDPKEVKGIDEDFVSSLANVLGNLAVGSAAVPRRIVAHNMGLPGSDTEQRISAALAAGALPGWASKPGRNGGIYRLEALAPSDEPSEEASPDEASAEASSEPCEAQEASSEPSSEQDAEPVKAPKRGKRKGKAASSSSDEATAAE